MRRTLVSVLLACVICLSFSAVSFASTPCEDLMGNNSSTYCAPYESLSDGYQRAYNSLGAVENTAYSIPVTGTLVGGFVTSGVQGAFPEVTSVTGKMIYEQQQLEFAEEVYTANAYQEFFDMIDPWVDLIIDICEWL